MGLPGESKPLRFEPVIWPPNVMPERTPERIPERTPEPVKEPVKEPAAP
jgi:hypothetical protein